MTRKRAPKGAPQVQSLRESVATRIGNDDDEMVRDGVAITVGPDGRAFFLPAALRRATPRQRRVMQGIQDRVAANVAILAQLDELVADARAAGLSWHSIGWLTGMSAQGARKRWADESPAE